MPQVPTLQSQIAPRAAPNIQRRPLQSVAGETLGAGLGNAGGLLHRIELEERDKADRAAVIDATSMLTAAENELLYNPESGAYSKQGKNAFNLSGQVLPEYDKRAGKIIGELKTPRQKQIFAERLKEQRGRVERDLGQHEYQQRERYYDEADSALIVSSIESAGRSNGDPERVATELATQRAVIDGMARRKGWDDITRQAKLREFESKTHEAVIGRFLVENRYDDAGRYLAANATRMPDPAVEAMQRRVILEEEQQYQRQERERRRVGDVVTKEGDRLYATGALTSGWIENNRATLSPEDYRYFYRRLKGEDGSGPSDAILYADLRDRAGRGEDVRSEAREALRRGSIGASDYDRILGEVEGERPGWYKRGKEFISTSAAVSDLNPDPAAAQRKAAMINDWDEWAQANPKAKDSDARAAAERLVQEYAIVDTSKFTLVKRTPRFLVGGRRAPDLDATASATVKAYEDGTIDRDEFERQAALIKEWEEAMRLAPKPKAKPDGR